MRHALRLHPDSADFAATHVEVEVTRPRSGSLLLRYFVTGQIGDLRLPPVTAPARTDELWRATCFELFVRASPDAGYYELNFAPSTQWAAYWLTDYRSSMRVATEIGTPRIEVRSASDCYTMQVALELDQMSRLPRDAGWRLGLSALIEDTGGRKSYWALAHPPGKPDFHHTDCFAHDFSPA